MNRIFKQLAAVLLALVLLVGTALAALLIEANRNNRAMAV